LPLAGEKEGGVKLTVSQGKEVSERKMAEAKRVGKITHYYDKIGVAVVAVEFPILVGDEIEIRDKNGAPRFTQTVSSMQVEHENIEKAKKGQDIGLKIDQEVKEGDLIYKISN